MNLHLKNMSTAVEVTFETHKYGLWEIQKELFRWRLTIAFLFLFVMRIVR